MKEVKKKSLSIGVSRYLLASPFGEGLGVRLLFRYIVAILLLVVGVGQEAHAQYVITKESCFVRHLAVSFVITYCACASCPTPTTSSRIATMYLNKSLTPNPSPKGEASK